MIPFVLGAVIGGVAATALIESKIGKKISREDSKLIDTLDDRITAFVKKVDKDHEVCKTLKDGCKNISSKIECIFKGEKWIF